jgi:fructose 1,6-bisphosphate aldolase/phosphatase
MADKTSPGAWNLPLFKMFADPFNSAGLIIDLKCIKGFRFDVLDVKENKLMSLECPDEMYYLLVLIGAPEHYMINGIYRRTDGEVGAVGSVQKLSLIAGKYVGKDDPVLIVRAQSGFPAVGEVLEPFAFPHTVAGWMRGSHNGPLMPVPWRHATPSRFDGPPRVICAGFQIQDGKLIGPVDLFDDPSFDNSRKLANDVADYLRRHGPFEPHRLPLDMLEYTTLNETLKMLKPRMKKLD